MNQERLYKVLLGAHISEKATVIADEANQFAFRVARDATRPEIKEAVEKIYKVKVTDVRTANRRGKPRRTRHGRSTSTSGWKKAVVVLHPDSHIDLF